LNFRKVLCEVVNWFNEHGDELSNSIEKDIYSPDE
jgi:hypothetical protein